MTPPGPRDAEDTALLAALQAGEEAAFARLVELHGGRLRATALRLLQRPDLADDAVQEAFLSAFRALPDFRGEAALSTWLHRILVNAALKRRRGDARREEREERDMEELLPAFVGRGAFAAPQVPWNESAEDPLVREETRRRVREAIDRLPERYRLPLVLRDLEGLGNDELARALEIGPNAAKVRVHRARQALRALLDPMFRDAEDRGGA